MYVCVGGWQKGSPDGEVGRLHDHSERVLDGFQCRS